MRLFRRDPPPAAAATPYLSTGVPALDAVLGGGLAPARLTVVRSAGGAGTRDFRAWAMPALRAALASGYGALLTVAADEDAATLWAETARRARDLDVEGRVRVVDYSADVAAGPWHVPLHPQLSPRVAVPRMTHAEQAARGPNGGPVLEVWCFDALEPLVGAAGAARLVQSAAGRLREIGHWALLWAPREGAVLNAARAAGPVELVLTRDGGGLSMSGVRPPFPAIFVAG